MSDNQKSSWTDFFTRERKKLVGYVRSRIDDAADRDGEDIVQDVMTGLFDSPDIGAPIENLAAYVYQALRNRVIDYLRRRKEHESLDADLPGDTGLTLADIMADLKFDSVKELERKEINKDISAAIDMLDEKYKSIFIATELQGMTFQDLSEEWEVPIGTLLARKSRAMKKLREALLSIDSNHYSCLMQERTDYV